MQTLTVTAIIDGCDHQYDIPADELSDELASFAAYHTLVETYKLRPHIVAYAYNDMYVTVCYNA